MKKISKFDYLNKVKGCWLGKNAGGTLGAPFESVRTAEDVEFYTHDLSLGVLPNDDLDLQLAWLNAAEKHGKCVDSKILAEYWITAVTPNWAEYGMGKTNLRLGLQPPLSGAYKNRFKDSNGAWIRSEIWACLAPGHPEIAVRYAYEDAIVDHADEGVYAEVFTAAIESAAFVEKDVYKLIDIGFSYIPKDCDIAKAARLVISAYKEGLTWKEARIRLLKEIPDSFGQQRHNSPNPDNFPVAEWGYDAPANIGLVILGVLYGEGDFGKSICITAGCGEDGDCTAATVGALLGIMLGADKLPSKWLDPIGEEIKTCSLNVNSSAVKIPKTITELTNRTCKIMPAFMHQHFDMFSTDAEISVNEGEELYDIPRDEWMLKPIIFKDTYPETFFTFTDETAIMRVEVGVPDGIGVREGDVKKLKIHAENLSGFVGSYLWLQLRWNLPEGWSIDKGDNMSLLLEQYHCGSGNAYAEVEVTVGKITEPVTTIGLEVSAHDRVDRAYIPIQFVCEA